jgi:CRP/FNR family transcriptional regulator, cyclic AMP receptor protein
MAERRSSRARSQRYSPGRVAISRGALAEREAALSKAPLFSDLPKRHLRSVGRVAWVREFPEGARIVKEGSLDSAFFVILEGRARVVRDDRTIARLRRGDFFGEISLLDQGPRTATVVADSSLRCLTLAGQDFRQIMEREPRLAVNIAAGLARRLRRREQPLL